MENFGPYIHHQLAHELMLLTDRLFQKSNFHLQILLSQDIASFTVQPIPKALIHFEIAMKPIQQTPVSAKEMYAFASLV